MASEQKLEIELRVDPEYAMELVLALSSVDDVEVKFADAALAAEQVCKGDHPMYSLGPADLTAILVAASGTVSSVAKLVKIILDHRFKMAKLENQPKKLRESSIRFKNKTAALTKFSTPAELSGFLEGNLPED